MTSPPCDSVSQSSTKSAVRSTLIVSASESVECTETELSSLLEDMMFSGYGIGLRVSMLGGIRSISVALMRSRPSFSYMIPIPLCLPTDPVGVQAERHHALLRKEHVWLTTDMHFNTSRSIHIDLREIVPSQPHRHLAGVSQ